MSRFGLRTLSALACLAGSLLASNASWAQPDGPLFTPEEMKQGIVMTGRDCAAYRSTVHVVASGVGLCFRYHLSTAGGRSDDVVYFLQGDHAVDKLAYDPAELDRTAEKLSTGYRRPAIYLARMGTDGSSGSARYRRTWLEVEATHLAIDAINARHGFRGIHLMGQSGGAHLTGALVGTRTDIGCAVPGSGRLAFDEQYRAAQAGRPQHERHYSPDTALAEVVQNSHEARILVVTDPNDQRVPSHMQTDFVRKVQHAGGRIAQFFVTATDPLNHGAVPYVRRAMAGCLAGRSDEEIGASLDRLSRERLAAKAAARQAAAQGTGTPPPPPPGAFPGPGGQPPHGPAIAYAPRR